MSIAYILVIVGFAGYGGASPSMQEFSDAASCNAAIVAINAATKDGPHPDGYFFRAILCLPKFIIKPSAN